MALPTFVAAGTASGSITDATPGLPAGLAENDIMLLFTECNVADTVTAPTGWTEVPDSPQAADTGTVGTSTKLQVFWRRATASESAPVVADPGNHVLAYICAFRGCETSGDPWDVTSGGFSTNTADTTTTVPGDTTTAADRLVVVAVADGTDLGAGGGARFSNWANADLANVLEVADFGTAQGGGGGVGTATGEKATAGAYGNTTVDHASGQGHAYMTIALKPPAAGGAVKPKHLGTLGVG